MIRGLLLLLLLATSGCGALFARDESERDPFGRDAELFERGELVVFVDETEGFVAARTALDALRARLGAWTGRPIVVTRAPVDELLRVLYRGTSEHGYRGYCGGRTLTIYKEQIRRHEVLWIDAATIERTVLVHEAGHAIGLGHCTRPDCVMYKPRDREVWDWRMVLANWPGALFGGDLPDELCPLCEEDLSSR